MTDTFKEVKNVIGQELSDITFSIGVDKRVQVKKLQNDLTERLSKIEDWNFIAENKDLARSFSSKHQLKVTRGDSMDIYGTNKKTDDIIIVELDPHRADQIAKKFTSRIALFLDVLGESKSELLYIIVVYPGTDKMSIPETKKYIEYCKIIGEQFNIKVVDYHTSDLDEKWGDSNG